MPSPRIPQALATQGNQSEARHLVIQRHPFAHCAFRSAESPRTPGKPDLGVMRQVRDVEFCAEGNVDEEHLGRESEAKMTPEGRLGRHIKDAFRGEFMDLQIVSWYACFAKV